MRRARPSWQGHVVPRQRRIPEAWGRFVGPEATAVNHAVTAVTTIGGAVVAAVVARRRGGRAGAVTAASLMAADLIGGAYVNNTLASVRWYERPDQPAPDRQHYAFAAAHLHPFVIALGLDRGFPRRCDPRLWAAAHYGYLLAATVIIRKAPRLRRPLGVALTAGGLVLDRQLGRSHLLPWFAAAYYPKLLLGHAAGSLWPDSMVEHSVVGSRETQA